MRFVVYVVGMGDYFDLKNSWLYIKVKILRVDGIMLDLDEKVGFVNNVYIVCLIRLIFFLMGSSCLVVEVLFMFIKFIYKIC